MRFVLRLRDGKSMASLCREFGISRVTGYKIFHRYKECGLEGLTDRARTPYRYAHKLPAQLEAMIVSRRREKPTWGARKLRDRLLRKLPNDVRLPACSTFSRSEACPKPFVPDNGTPFASPNGLFNLSRLAVWWLRLGITIERIQPGHPQQNGRHERMHRTLKIEATRPVLTSFSSKLSSMSSFASSTTSAHMKLSI